MIQTPEHVHRAKSEADYRAQISEAMEKRRRSGFTDAVHEEMAPLLARVDHGRWIVDCECGAGNSVHPEWSFAGCMACGAIHLVVIIPPDWKAIEAALNNRKRDMHRNWTPGETLEQLHEENRLHPAHVKAR